MQGIYVIGITNLTFKSVDLSRSVLMIVQIIWIERMVYVKRINVAVLMRLVLNILAHIVNTKCKKSGEIPFLP